MISVEEAIELVQSNLVDSQIIDVPLGNALGLVLAEDIFSTINMPPFRQSAMDGYAACINNSIAEYELIGEIAAGDSGLEYSLQQGQAVRIFTGARVPKGANVVVPQEIAINNDKTVSFERELKENACIRPLGEQTRKGDLSLPKGSTLSPSSIGFLAGLGVTNVKVYQKPTVSILATGNELVPPGQELPEGKIYESNSIMLKSAIQQSGFDCKDVEFASDNFKETKQQIERSFEQSNVLLISGGISVGEYDFVEQALEEIGVEKVFYKVKQKPGKPLFFGKWKNKLVFALPGNPAAALTCFYIYVLNALKRISGGEGLPTQLLELTDDYIKKGDRAQFLKAKTRGKYVEILEGQNSSMLHTYALADALVYVSSNSTGLPKGTKVKTYILPQ